MTRKATIRTDHDDPELVARAVAPDNTAEMETTVEEGRLVTQIVRETTGGLHSNVDDYVVNVGVAAEVAQHERQPSDGTSEDRHESNNE